MTAVIMPDWQTVRE